MSETPFGKLRYGFPLGFGSAVWYDGMGWDAVLEKRLAAVSSRGHPE
ncbi:MAG: hypothetical protein J6A08_08980 [Lachnospiraceae bacterium]|nr:hypothetical protein [Lachnospiraceae bacterium]